MNINSLKKKLAFINNRNNLNNQTTTNTAIIPDPFIPAPFGNFINPNFTTTGMNFAVDAAPLIMPDRMEITKLRVEMAEFMEELRANRA